MSEPTSESPKVDGQEVKQTPTKAKKQHQPRGEGSKRGRAQGKGIAIELEPIIGTRDFYPEDMRLRNWLFDHFRAVANLFAFQVSSRLLLIIFTHFEHI